MLRHLIALLCLLAPVGCAVSDSAFRATEPLRHASLAFDDAAWSTQMRGRGPGESMVIAIRHRENGVVIGITDFEDYKPLRMQAVVLQQLKDEMPRQFNSVTRADKGLPLNDLVPPAGWSCEHFVVTKELLGEPAGYTGCVHSNAASFAYLVVVTALDAGKDEIAAANVVLSTVRTD